MSRVEPSAAAGVAATASRLSVGLLAEIDEILVDDAAHAVQRAVDVGDGGKRRASSATPTSD